MARDTSMIKVLARWWFVALFGVVAAVAASAFALHATPQQYTAGARVLLLPPPSTTSETPNPLLRLDGLLLPAQVLSRYLQAAAEEQAEPEVTTRAAVDGTTSAPVIALEASGADSPTVMAELLRLQADVPQALAQLEDDLAVPAGSRLRTLVIASDDRAVASGSDAPRLAVAILTGGLLLTVGAVAALDRLRYAPRPERARRSIEGVSVPAPGLPSPTKSTR